MAKRSDGYYLKGINPYQKLVPHIMTSRVDSMVMSKVSVRCERIDRFIKEQLSQGVSYSYVDILIASIVRLYAMRPALNRFVMRGKIYQHYDITVAFVVKKKMKDDSEDTTVKIHFDGSESLPQIKEAIAKKIAENTGDEVFNGTDKTADALTRAPHWLIGFLVNVLRFLDRHNLLPKSIIEVSPFHNSVFVTLLKSIKGDYVYHHCYNFGTTGIFIGVGKEQSVPVVECGELKIGRVLDMGIVADERFCDGLYFVNSMRMWKRLLASPDMLLQNYDLSNSDNIVHGVIDKEKLKRDRKRAKEEKKRARKENKANK